MDKAARLQVLRPAERGDAMPFICLISNVCQARVRSAEFSMIIYSESQLMDNNSFDVRWVTAHGPRHSALVKPSLEKRGPQGLEP